MKIPKTFSVKNIPIFFLLFFHFVSYSQVKLNAEWPVLLENLKRMNFEVMDGVPCSLDYEDFKNNKFAFRDSTIVSQLIQYKDSVKPYLLQKMDTCVSVVYLVAFLKIKEALPKLRHLVLIETNIYGWEGPDYTKMESFIEDAQYCKQLMYMAVIEHIAGIKLKVSDFSKQELKFIKNQAKNCKPSYYEGANTENPCYYEWLKGILKLK